MMSWEIGGLEQVSNYVENAPNCNEVMHAFKLAQNSSYNNFIHFLIANSLLHVQIFTIFVTCIYTTDSYIR